MKPAARNNSVPDFFSTQVSQARRFFLDLNPNPGQRLAVVCGGCEHCAAEYAIHRGSFPFYSLEYVVHGRGSVTLRNRRHLLQPGSLFSYGPAVRHDIATDPREPLVKYFVDFTGTGAQPLLRACGLPPGTVARIFPPGELQALFDELIQSGIRGTRHTPNVCAKLLECLALKIVESRAPAMGAEALSFRTYQICRQHIQQHFQRLRTLEQIARECHLDGAYLCRLFRRYDHQSPYRCLLRLKMNQAAGWLQQPGALVKQVSERAGFADPFHFSRAFKNVLGLSPDAFRRLR